MTFEVLGDVIQEPGANALAPVLRVRPQPSDLGMRAAGSPLLDDVGMPDLVAVVLGGEPVLASLVACIVVGERVLVGLLQVRPRWTAPQHCVLPVVHVPGLPLAAEARIVWSAGGTPLSSWS